MVPLEPLGELQFAVAFCLLGHSKGLLQFLCCEYEQQESMGFNLSMSFIWYHQY